MNSLPAETSLLAVACPRCRASIAVPLALFGQPAACPICGGGFLAPQAVSPQAVSPQAVSPQAVSPQAVSPQAVSPQAVPGILPELPLFDPSGPPLQTIRHGGKGIELRRLTPEEKAVRRTRRTIVMIGGGTAILFAIVLLAARGGGKKKRR